MPKQVRLQVGYVGDEEEGAGISPSVYERPVMMVYEGIFDSMDGEVTIADHHINLLAKNHNSLLERVKRLATGEIPLRDCPPLQLDHSTSARDTIGRLVGALSTGYIDIDGAQKLALFGRARFLGEENVEKARDGRYTHVSIGADLESGVINELSVTPFPAAPNASLLSKPDDKGKEKPMHEKLKKHLMDSKKMSEEDAEKLSKECLAHHMSKMGLDDEKMGKHLAAADDKELSRMSDEHDADKKLSAEKEEKEKKEEDEKKLTRKNDFTKLALGIRTGNVELRAELRKTTIASRLARLRGEAKITPAEIKKLDIVKMAALDDTAMNAALDAFESREPVIRFGSVNGSNKAEAIEQITKKYRLARMELESRLNMPMKAKEARERLSRLGEEEKKELSEAGKDETPSKGMLTKMTFEDLSAMVDDKSKHEELKKHLQHMMDHHGLEVPEHSDAHMSTLAKKQAELQTNLEQLIALASPVLGIKPDELK